MRFRHHAARKILVYKTDIEGLEQIRKLKPVLTVQTAILYWSVDLEDVDKVLRIETASLEENFIPLLLAKHNLDCVPLTY